MIEFRTKPVCASPSAGLTTSRTAACNQRLIALLLLVRIRNRDLNECALLHGIGWINGHLLPYFETVGDLQLDPVIATRLHRLEMDAPDPGQCRRIDSLSAGLLPIVLGQRLERRQHGS